MKFSNRDRLRRRMKAIPTEVKNGQRAQIKANADELMAMQRRASPKGEEHALAKSIRDKDTSTSTRIQRRIYAGGEATTKPVRNSKKGAPQYDYALGQEFGNEHNEAQPFFIPPYRAKKRAFKARNTRAAKRDIAKGAGAT